MSMVSSSAGFIVTRCVIGFSLVRPVPGISATRNDVTSEPVIVTEHADSQRHEHVGHAGAQPAEVLRQRKLPIFASLIGVPFLACAGDICVLPVLVHSHVLAQRGRHRQCICGRMG